MNTVHAVVATLLLLATFGYRYISFVDFSNDHFVHLSTAQQIVHGAMPVRDFVERGLPLMSVMSAAAQVALGEGLKSEVILIAAAFAATAVLTYLLAARLSGSVIVGLAAALLPVFAYPVSYSYPKLLAPALGFLAGWNYCVRPTTGRAVFLAAAIAIAFLLRHDLGVLLGAASVLLIAGRHGMTRVTLVEAGRVALFALLMTAPYLVWVQVYEGIGGYVRDGISFSRREAQKANWWTQTSRFQIDSSRPLISRLGSGPVINVRWKDDASDADIAGAEARHGLMRRDPNSPRSWQYELQRWTQLDMQRLVKDPLAADTHGVDRTTFVLQVPAPEGIRAWLINAYGPGEGLRLGDNAFVALFYLVWLLPLAAAATLAWRWQQTPPMIRGLVVMIVAVQLAMNVTMLRDPLVTRIRDVLVPCALLAAYLAGLAWYARSTFRGAYRVAVAAALVALIGGTAAFGEARVHAQQMNALDGVEGIRKKLRSIRRTMAPPDHHTGARSPIYQPIVEYVTRCTKPESRLLTLTFAPELFFYTARDFAGGQVSMAPGYFVDGEHGSLMLERLSKEDVPLVILDSETRDEMLQYPKVGAHVTSSYREVARFPIRGNKEFILLAETARRPVSAFGDKRLPCWTANAGLE